MDGREFARLRALTKRSRRELAVMLGVSAKTIEAYEQGWRTVPPALARTLHYFALRIGCPPPADLEPCWEIRGCSGKMRAACPAGSCGEGTFCWFFTGRLAPSSGRKTELTPEGTDQCREKIGCDGSECERCPVFTRLGREADHPEGREADHSDGRKTDRLEGRQAGHQSDTNQLQSDTD